MLSNFQPTTITYSVCRFHVPKKLPTAADVVAGISRLPAAPAGVPDRAIEPEKRKE